MEDPGTISMCIHHLFCAKNIERIGDHATNIAEAVHYMVEGQAIAGERPKGDISSYVGETLEYAPTKCRLKPLPAPGRRPRHTIPKDFQSLARRR